MSDRAQVRAVISEAEEITQNPDRDPNPLGSELGTSPVPQIVAPRPPEDDTCLECFEWRQMGDRGWGWWMVCDHWRSQGPRCDHAHHDSEAWGAPS